MLHLLDESLEAFLRATVPLSRREVDVSFEAPDSEWSARLSRPTVNLYLWDVRRNLEQRDGGVEIIVGEDGVRRRRPPLPRVDCRYLITAWTSEVRDEHSLLGATLTALLRHQELEQEYLHGPLANVRPVPAIEVALGDGRDNSDFWSALGGQLKPGLDVVVTATVDAPLYTEVGPPVDTYTIRTQAGSDTVSERHILTAAVTASRPGTAEQDAAGPNSPGPNRPGPNRPGPDGPGPDGRAAR